MQNLDSLINDIIAIGAGGCGLMAALVAAKKRAQVLLLENTDKGEAVRLWEEKKVISLILENPGRLWNTVAACLGT